MVTLILRALSYVAVASAIVYVVLSIVLRGSTTNALLFSIALACIANALDSIAVDFDFERDDTRRGDE